MSASQKKFYSNAGCCSRLTFSWVDRLLSKGRKGTLSDHDLQLPAELKCDEQCDAFTASWVGERLGDSPSLARALWKTYSSEICKVGIIKGVWGAVLIFTAFFLVRSLVAFMAKKSASDDIGYGLSGGFFAACLVRVWLLN